MVGLWYQQDQKNKAAAALAAAAEKPAENVGWEQQKEELAVSNSDAKALNPTAGKQIPLDYMPFVPHLVFHIRPAEVWAKDQRHQEFVNLAFDLNTWLRGAILAVTKFEPEEIEELTFALNFGPRTSAPGVAAVVRLLNEQTSSEFQLKRFRGQVNPNLGPGIFEAEDYLSLIHI